MTTDLFDRQLRSLRRDRAARTGVELFLLNRAFDDCLDRLVDIPRQFERALLLGAPSPEWPARLEAIAKRVDVFDPGEIFARRSAGHWIDEDRHDFGQQDYDLCVAIGTLDTVNDLPLALRSICKALRRDSPMVGAIAGGNSLPSLRTSLIEAGRAEGKVVARTHPRIEPSSLAQLLAAAGFTMPVVDVDRVRLRYDKLSALVSDLRAMAASAVLAERPPPLSRKGAKAAAEAFTALGADGRTEETVEILHFLAWAH